jgi:hypothetical protein
MTSAVRQRDALGDSVRTGIREVSAVWWWFLIHGITSTSASVKAGDRSSITTTHHDAIPRPLAVPSVRGR